MGLEEGGRGPRPVGIAQRPRPVGGPECREDERPGWGGAGTAVLAAAGEPAPSQRSHVGRERRVAAASAQAVLLQCGFQGAPPTSLQSQPSLSLRYAPIGEAGLRFCADASRTST